MSPVQAPRKYLTLALRFPVDSRFSFIPANIESPTMRHGPFGKGRSDKSCLHICRDIFCELQLIVLHMSVVNHLKYQ